MRRSQVALSLAVIVSGLYLLLSFSCARGQEEPIPSKDAPTQPAPVSPFSGCLPLPEQAPENAQSRCTSLRCQKSPGSPVSAR